jgi:hypothetical protein
LAELSKYVSHAVAVDVAISQQITDIAISEAAAYSSTTLITASVFDAVK